MGISCFCIVTVGVVFAVYHFKPNSTDIVDANAAVEFIQQDEPTSGTTVDDLDSSGGDSHVQADDPVNVVEEIKPEEEVQDVDPIYYGERKTITA